MNMIEELALLLPTKGARWSAGLTSTLLPLAFLAPHFLSPLMPTATEVEIILAQILLPSLLATFGALLTLALVIRAYKELINSHKREIEKIEQKHNEYVALICKPSLPKPNPRI